MNLLEKMIRDLEDMAAANPNRPLGDLWVRMREDENYRKAMGALTIFDDRAAFEDVARAELTGATKKGTHKTPRGTVQEIPLEEIVGRTIEEYTTGTSEGAYGKEPTIWLYFTDGTRHGFVLPSDSTEIE